MATPSTLLYKTLLSAANFEVVGEPQEKPNQIRFMGRVRSRAHSKVWTTAVVHSLLEASRGAPWSIDISRQYFLRGDDLLWGWRVIVQGENLSDRLSEIAHVVARSTSPRNVPPGEVTAMPLVGSPKTRSGPINGKGATGIKDV